ncbi:MAG: hypothetical protein U9Q03_02795 [Patescibacteria group bacterium]|nr:hypothetical protein [Patescibacteria group bacterium]
MCIFCGQPMETHGSSALLTFLIALSPICTLKARQSFRRITASIKRKKRA